MSDESYEFFATCPKGFERLLAGELASLSLPEVRSLNGQVAFSATLAQSYRACLWSRLASRIVLVLAHKNAANSDELYASLIDIPWEEHLNLAATFAVDAHGTNDELRNTQFVALRAKDAICDRMQAKLGGRPNVDTHHPDISIVVRVHTARATIGIDFSGDPLFRRQAVRRSVDDGLGNLRADYAAALLAAGTWHRCCRHDAPTLLAAYAGSGTVLVEAAGIALDRAAGLLRTHWGFEQWLGHDADAWNMLIDEADERAEKGAERADSVSLICLDTRSGAASTARQALVSAGFGAVPLTVLSHVDDLPAELGKLSSSSSLSSSSLLVPIDLSWVHEGEQAQEVAALGLTSRLVDMVPSHTTLVSLAVGTSVETAVGQAPTTSTDVFVGRTEAHMCTYVKEPEDPSTSRETSDDASSEHALHTVTVKNGTVIPVLIAASDQFAARLTKVNRLRRKWARREAITCYRLYDADLPDYAVAIDLYEASEQSRGADAHARWLVVQEYAAPHSVDPDLAHKRLLDVLAIAPQVVGVDPANITMRVRQRACGGSQYAGGGRTPARSGRRPGWLELAPGAHLVDEGGLTFEVNFGERLDTGLFLDHRDVRSEVREMAKATKGSKRFLNLFAYTGTATCYAADGGAIHTTTVDLSRTYLDWARRNMARNGFTENEHEYVQADVVSWISEQRHTPNRWDLVFCDPPTFSNSKRMSNSSFDVQRDHAELLIGISRVLTSNGVCLFSCNLRDFTPEVDKLKRAGVEIRDITAETIPEDFARNAKIHHCYFVRRTPRN